MRFPNRPFAIEPTPSQPDATTIYRPFVPLRVIGSTGSVTLLGLLDTGADETVMPALLVSQIGVTLDPGASARFRGVGGHVVTASYGTVDLEVSRGRRSYRWPATVAFLEGSNMVILGHGGFLQHFTATFSGPRRQVTLTARNGLTGTE
jgi:hypothetical protein